MSSTTLTQAAALAASVARQPKDLDKHLSIVYALDHLSAVVDGEEQAVLQNALSDIQGNMIAAVDEILENEDVQTVERYMASEGFAAAYQWREEKIAKDAEVARRSEQWKSYLLERQVA